MQSQVHLPRGAGRVAAPRRTDRLVLIDGDADRRLVAARRERPHRGRDLAVRRDGHRDGPGRRRGRRPRRARPCRTRRRHLAAHAGLRADDDPQARRRTGRRARRADRADHQRRGREDDHRGPGRGVALGRPDPAGRVRGHPAVRRRAAAGRQPRHGPGQAGVHHPPAGGYRGGDHAVQLSGAAGHAQAGARAGGGQRGRAQARQDHAADRAGPGPVLHRRRAAGRGAVGGHRPGRGAWATSW